MGAVHRIAKELRCSPEAGSSWVEKTQVDSGLGPGATIDEAARIKGLEKESRELRQANEMLHKANAHFAQADLDHWWRSSTPSSTTTNRSSRPGRPSVTGPVNVARCTAERLIGALGPLHGVRRAEPPSTTRSASQNRRPTDLVRRRFKAVVPNGR
ncbi:hypothetical protein MANAM107_09960 [Actinomyces capricornis]|uniref:Transposase n=1 Tax=Actinomyces capricornis TaxID=2755559 RepID=A0ABM7U9P7_9ACTO|nr:hypothetical protein MANAM107_09960 [Actinomyces capricornis]